MRRSLMSAALGVAVLALGTAAPALAGDYCPQVVPELDPSVAQSALTLLVGGVLTLFGRRRNEG